MSLIPHERVLYGILGIPNRRAGLWETDEGLLPC
jgi:hypothetical protein